jgi:DNA-binding NtrC family response regulator
MAFENTFNSGSEVLVLDDDAVLRKRLAAHLRRQGAEVAEAGSLAEARRLLGVITFDFALVDLHLPDGDALELLRGGEFSENTGVVVMTAIDGVQPAVEAMRLGAGDYLSKPFSPDELPLAFAHCRNARRAVRREETPSAATQAEELFFGDSLSAVRSQLDRVVQTDRRLGERLPPVLIEGATGTGKTVLARWLNQQGPRAQRPFVAVNCAAMPDTLADSELFGHERGAFTDAKKARLGLFEAADGGTLFLDEIGSLSPSTQAKILTALEEGRIRRLGGTREIKIDVRIIAATNRPLSELVEAKLFREDLYQRLNLLRFTLPPLCERRVDIVPLAKHLLQKIAARYRLKGTSITREGEDRLKRYPWPGNVRELSHQIERAVIFADGKPLDFSTLGETTPTTPTAEWRNPAWRLPETGFSLDAAMNEFIAEALRETNGNVTAAARRLGVTRDFLRYRLDESAKPATA